MHYIMYALMSNTKSSIDIYTLFFLEYVIDWFKH